MSTRRRRLSHGRGSAPRGPLDLFEDAFARLMSRAEPLGLHGEEIHPRLPGRLMRLDELRDLLFDSDPALEVVDAIWRTVASRARAEGGDWTTGTIGMALPALRHRSMLLAWGYHGDPADIDAEMVAGFLLALRPDGADLDEPGVLDRLCAPGRAAARAVRYADARHLPVGRSPHSTRPQAPWGHPDFVLARAVAAGVITARDADLIGRTRLEGAKLAEVAAATGESVWTLQRRRHRAEDKLAAAMSAGQVSGVALRAKPTRDGVGEARRNGVANSRQRPTAARASA